MLQEIQAAPGCKAVGQLFAVLVCNRRFILMTAICTGHGIDTVAYGLFH